MRLALILAFLLTAGAVQAQALRQFVTGNDSRGWDAVGRLELDGRGFCTATLVAPDLVLTAAHCLYDSKTGERIPSERIEFRAGWRNGRASAYRQVRRAAIHPEYTFMTERRVERVMNDLALLELHHPIRNGAITPFRTTRGPRAGEQVAVVSYAHDRAEAASMQDACTVIGRKDQVYVMSCNVDFGSSGAPVFTLVDDEPRIVSVISAKADMDGEKVALGNALEGAVMLLQSEMDTPRVVNRGGSGTGAKFIRVPQN